MRSPERSENAQISVNGEIIDLSCSILIELLERRGITSQRGIAVAVNGAVVPREAWRAHMLQDGDRLEIIKIKVGG